MKLSIITLTLNNIKYTKKFIKDLYKYTTDFELIIVDNGSTDGTVEYLKTIDNIKVIYNDENMGFSKANNQALAIAEGEYIGFLNNDILLSANWFDECIKVFEKENAAFVSPREINPYYNNTNDKKYLKYFKKMKFEKDYEKDFDECVFSCVLTKKEIIDKIGAFDEEFSPAFFEDNEFKYRAIQNGYGIFVCNKACFFHYGSKTSINLNFNFEKNRKLYYENRDFAEYLTKSDEKIRDLEHKLRLMDSFISKMYYHFLKLNEKLSRRLAKLKK